MGRFGERTARLCMTFVGKNQVLYSVGRRDLWLEGSQPSQEVAELSRSCRTRQFYQTMLGPSESVMYARSASTRSQEEVDE